MALDPDMRPHTITAYAPTEGSDNGAGVEAIQWQTEPVTVLGMVESITAALAYTDYALVCERPLRVFADVDKESAFPLGTVFSWEATIGTKWGRVVAPVIAYDAERETSHIVVLAEVWSPKGMP